MPVERHYYPTLTEPDAKRPQVISTIVGNILRGNINVIIDVDVVDTSPLPFVIQDPRIHPLSYMQVMQMAPEPPAFYISATRQEEADLRWTGTGWGSKTLRVLLIG